MEKNRFSPNTCDSPGGSGPSERTLWLDELQRRFSADMDQKSELLYNSNPHVDGCSSESENEVSINPTNLRNGSSVFAPCSGGSKRKKFSHDEQIEDLYRIVKMQNRQINLLQGQITTLLQIMQQDIGGVSGGKNHFQKFYPRKAEQCGISAVSDGNGFKSMDSDAMPRCAAGPSNVSMAGRSDPNFFSAVIGTLRGVLDGMEPDDDVIESSIVNVNDSCTDKTMFNATLEQLKNLGVSFVERIPPAQKKVTFLENRRVRTESSVEIDSLAQKYLATKHPSQSKRNAAFDQINSLQKRTTDLSLATVKYLKRYKLAADSDRLDIETAGNQIRPQTDQVDDISDTSIKEGKMLDSFAIRNQPKLLPKTDWLPRKN